MSAKQRRRKGPLTIHRLFVPCLGADNGFHWVTIAVGSTGQLFCLTSECQGRPGMDVVRGLAPDTPLCLAGMEAIVADIERPCILFRKLTTSDATFSSVMDVAHRRAVEIRALRNPYRDESDQDLLFAEPFEEYLLARRIRNVCGLDVRVGVARAYRVVRFDGEMILVEMGGIWRPVVPVRRLALRVISEIARRLNQERPSSNQPETESAFDNVTDDRFDVKLNGGQE